MADAVVNPIKAPSNHPEKAFNAVRVHVAARIFANTVFDGFMRSEHRTDSRIEAAFIGM